MTKKVTLTMMEATRMQSLSYTDGGDSGLGFAVRLIQWFIEKEFLVNPDPENGISVSVEGGAIIFEKDFVDTAGLIEVKETVQDD